MKESGFSDFIRELKEKNDIVEVIGSYVKLERRGYNHWACCPFHHEKTPSFSVNAADKYYHCFGCGVSGDVIGFVKEYENVDFMQAVQILAARVGMSVPAFDDKTAEENAARKKKRDRLLLLMKRAARFYYDNLRGGRAEPHLAYLEKRGVKPSTANSFGIGASLDYRSLPAFLLGEGFTPEECADSGACVRTDDGRLIDAQGERLVIPIINGMDEVIAFGGRLLDKSDRAKYKNTRETELFDKSKNLFNLNHVKKLRRASAISSLIMVEGYMDAISLYEAGFRNVVASMGTSLTKEQARLCKRFTETVYISYDGDFAGQKANLRGLEILKDEGLKVRVVPLPEGLDPDDVIRRRGAEGYRECLGAAMPLADFRIFCAERKYDLSKTDEVREFVGEALPIVREAESETEREELLKRVAASARVSYTALMRDLERVPAAKAPPPPERKREDSPDGERRAERFVLAACLFSKPYAARTELSSFGFEGELAAIADFIERGKAAGNLRPSAIFEEMDAEGELSRVLDLDMGDRLDGADAEKYFADCVELLGKRDLRRKIEAYRAECETADPERRRELLSLIIGLTKKLNQ